ncbi:unnamed protein product [Sympodiomycopsis kandeliae]
MTTQVTGQKEASYHLPPKDSSIPSGEQFTLHHLRCLDSKIQLGFHIFPHIFHTLLAELKSSTYVLITDHNLDKLYGKAIEDSFTKAATSVAKPPRFLTYKLPPGETSKSRQVKEQIEDWMLSNHCVRDTVLLAFGGGVIGDLSGFVAATFMRGIKFVQIPTTLLAMVDSSVGGKTAIDTPHGKNLIGSFHQPQYIFIDAALLRSLPAREFSNGMAEVVKTAAIWDADDFAKLESASDAIRSAVLSPDALATPTQGRHSSDRSLAQTLLLDVIRGSVGVKAHIVNIDEKETGLRNLVNFGHSIGHAIEGIMTPDLLHGECVSIGMILEAEIAREMTGFTQVNLGRLTKALKLYDLPVTCNDVRVASLEKALGLSTQSVLDVMRMDKKNVGVTKRIVLLKDIGQCFEEKASDVPDAIITRVLAPQVNVLPFKPAEKQASTVKLSTPGSKSISNRALVLAALAKGTTRLRNLLHSDDTGVMMTGLKQLDAASFEWEDGGDVVVVHGHGGNLVTPADGTEIYLQNAGTAARFMTSVVALAKDPQGKDRPTVITGNARMKERPIAPLVEALRTNGVTIGHKEKDGFLPLAISGEKGFKGGKIQLAASISSQYVSSILLAAPLAKEEDVLLELVGGKVISQPYIDMTISMMRDFGAKVERLTDASGQPADAYRIARGGYVSPGAYDVESDASSATYPLAFAGITGSSVIVEKIGSASLQGDARFATDVLAPMGCKVTQTSSETHVTGPPSGALHQFESGEVDMEPMTDAFLTAAVLLAVAAPHPKSGAASTRIRGIANQRVKECNRIQAMMDELAKFGVKTVEHEDGLEVFGIDRSALQNDVSVHCYDDHRVAMAFSVLATVTPPPAAGTSEQGTILEEKRCVEKTWPNWWDDLSGKLGVTVRGVHGDLIPAHELTKAQKQRLGAKATGSRLYPTDSTIILIGMRASGKTYLGSRAAAALGRQFLDGDEIFVQRCGDIGEYIKANGWEGFRAKEYEVLEDFLKHHGKEHVISLGGGIVEFAQSRAALEDYHKNYGPVVHTVRELDEIIAFHNNTSRPSWGESVESVWERRRHWYKQCSSYEIINFKSVLQMVAKVDAADAKPANNGSAPATSIVQKPSPEGQVARLFGIISGTNNNQVDLTAKENDGTHRNSFLLTLTFPDVIPMRHLFEEISTGVDALELRVDLLSADGKPVTKPTVPSANYVASQLTALRLFSNLPVVYTVRTVSQGGMFPDEAEDEYFALIEQGIRMGVEYVDLQITGNPARLAEVRAQRGPTKILASWHDWTGGFKWSSADAWAKYDAAAQLGDIVKLVGKANSISDNVELEAFRLEASRRSGVQKPLLAINMFKEGQMSRVMNPILSLVTHPAMPTPGAPGQMSVADIQKCRTLLGQVQRKKVALFGKPVSQSLSPCLHNTAFETLGLPHHYERQETDVIDDKVLEYLRSPDFGGASVTIPLKVEFMKHVDELTGHAKAIGAINTVIPRRSEPGGPVTFVGDNTDWIAIHAMSVRSLPASALKSGDLSALVIGAGGSARAALYAAHKVGCTKIYLFNRTVANAVKLQEQVPKEWNVEVVERIDEPLALPPRVIVSNVPANGTSIDASNKDAGVIFDKAILSHEEGGVVIDMAYKPYHTPLLELVARKNKESATGQWTPIPGLTILLEQGCHQFKAWISREAPRGVVEPRCFDAYQSGQVP